MLNIVKWVSSWLGKLTLFSYPFFLWKKIYIYIRMISLFVKYMTSWSEWNLICESLSFSLLLFWFLSWEVFSSNESSCTYLWISPFKVACSSILLPLINFYFPSFTCSCFSNTCCISSNGFFLVLHRFFLWNVFYGAFEFANIS